MNLDDQLQQLHELTNHQFYSLHVMRTLTLHHSNLEAAANDLLAQLEQKKEGMKKRKNERELPRENSRLQRGNTGKSIDDPPLTWHEISQNQPNHHLPSEYQFKFKSTTSHIQKKDLLPLFDAPEFPSLASPRQQGGERKTGKVGNSMVKSNSNMNGMNQRSVTGELVESFQGYKIGQVVNQEVEKPLFAFSENEEEKDGVDLLTLAKQKDKKEKNEKGKIIQEKPKNSAGVIVKAKPKDKTKPSPIIPDEAVDNYSELLQSMFPNVTLEEITIALETSGNNLAKAVDSIVIVENSAKVGRFKLPDLRAKSPKKDRNSGICEICGVIFQDELDDAARKNIYKIHHGPVKKMVEERSKLIQQSIQAYARGEKSLAHERSKMASQLQEEIEQAEINSSGEIFYHFNCRHVSDPTKIDLHGLHTEEAIFYVMERLAFLRNFDVSHLTVITGVGNHSIGKAILLPSLIEALEKEKFGFDLSRAGQIIVKVKH